MQLQHALKKIFRQLNSALQALSPAEYSETSSQLFGATIGQHVRHIIELYTCLGNGYTTGMVNYEQRERNVRIEREKDFAASLLNEILLTIDRPDKVLMLEANYDAASETTILVETNYYREVLYNLEHTVHHMALIRVGINELSSVIVPAEFGVAASTVKHQQSCAQ